MQNPPLVNHTETHKHNVSSGPAHDETGRAEQKKHHGTDDVLSPRRQKRRWHKEKLKCAPQTTACPAAYHKRTIGQYTLCPKVA